MEEGVAEEYAQELLSYTEISLAEESSQEEEVVEMENRSPAPNTLCINSLVE